MCTGCSDQKILSQLSETIMKHTKLLQKAYGGAHVWLSTYEASQVTYVPSQSSWVDVWLAILTPISSLLMQNPESSGDS